MKKLFRSPLFYLALLLLAAYACAEIIIRGDALNQISFGIGGYLFWGGIVLLVYCSIILPILRFSTFPKWVEPDTISSSRDQIRYLEKMGKYYTHLFPENPLEEIADMISELKDTLKNTRIELSDYRAKLLRLVPEIHRQLSGPVCDRIIRSYMKRTAILVCVSQRGWLDSTAMLVMQIRMIVDLSRSLGYRPSCVFIIYCLGWVVVNSIAFALFDGSDILEDSLQELLPLVIGESAGKSLPFIGKFFGIVAQGASAMAIIYTTGKIVQRKLTGSHERLSGKERIAYRIEGYKEAVSLLNPLVKQSPSTSSAKQQTH